MARTNRECYTCGRSYYFCPSCPSDTKKETFYNMFCCERCSNIFKTLTDETFKKISTAQCKEKLLKLNVSMNENFKDGIKRHLEKVLNYKETVGEIIQEEIVLEKVETENIVPETTTEENEIKKNKYIPKKNRKKQNSEVD